MCRIDFKVNIWSIHDVPFLKPLCCSPKLLSICGSVLFRRTADRILYGTDEMAIPQ